MTEFTPLSAVIGGSLIGLSSVLLMALKGRIAGISGIALKMLPPYQDNEFVGRAAFLLGIVLAPGLVWMLSGQKPPLTMQASGILLLVAGVLVGFGSVWGSGCTSGHGVCGLSRLSKRSMIAVATFMTTAVITVYVMRHVL